MRLAILFNSDHPIYGSYYGGPVRDAIFATNILQNARRHMKMAVGDALIYSRSKTWEEYDALTRATYTPSGWHKLKNNKLSETFRKNTIYVVSLENATRDIAEDLDEKLSEIPAYLGSLAIYRDNPIQWLFLCRLLIQTHRFFHGTANIFYDMGEEDGKDEEDLKALETARFINVKWEDTGARHTIFNKFADDPTFKKKW